MSVFLRLGFSALLLFCARAQAQGPECGAGCHHGVCEQSGECRCVLGWRGAACDQCVPAVECAHGRCEEPGQCICDDGWSGARCDQDARPCALKPCSGNTTCVYAGGGRGHVCVCAAGHTGQNCQTRDGGCSGDGSCGVGGSCVRASDGRLRCVYVHRLKHRARAPAPHYTALHKLVRMEADTDASALGPRARLLGVGLLGLLTALVILGSAAIVFLPRCQAWVANARFRRLLRRHQQHQPPLKLILPEKIQLSRYGARYTSI